jgi:hypothetical protein
LPGVSPTPQDLAELARLRRLGRLLDSAVRVPGTGVRLGLDPLIGLVPGLGDWAGAAFSAYILLGAARLGVTRSTLLRMFANIAAEVVLGAVPVLGDIFDVAWRANDRNLDLLTTHLADPTQRRRRDTGFVALLLVGLLGLVAAAVALTTWLTLSFVRAVAG